MLNVSIVTYKTPADELLNAIETCSKSHIVHSIIVIDNSPIDHLRDIVSNNKKTVYKHNPSNPGYGAAHNLAINQSLSEGLEYHLVLNADVIFDFKILEKMFRHAKLIDNLGILAPKMFYEDGTNQCSRKLLPTPMNMFLRAIMSQNYRSKIDELYELKCFSYDQHLLVPYVSGAFMLLNTKVLSQVGLFDERYFMYPEDIDLSRRIADVADVLFCPDYTIIHKYGGDTRKSYKMFIIHVVNMCRYFNKWGWFIDKNRSMLNQKTLMQFKQK
jgi:GT2 family glycosyltransferase